MKWSHQRMQAAEPGAQLISIGKWTDQNHSKLMPIAMKALLCQGAAALTHSLANYTAIRNK